MKLGVIKTLGIELFDKAFEALRMGPTTEDALATTGACEEIAGEVYSVVPDVNVKTRSMTPQAQPTCRRETPGQGSGTKNFRKR